MCIGSMGTSQNLRVTISFTEVTLKDWRGDIIYQSVVSSLVAAGVQQGKILEVGDKVWGRTCGWMRGHKV